MEASSSAVLRFKSPGQRRQESRDSQLSHIPELPSIASVGLHFELSKSF